MPYVITQPCVADFSCLEVCPVDCISPGPDDESFVQAEQLYIDPAACIDCAACVDACPVEAIYKAELLPEKWRHYTDVNRDYFIAEVSNKVRHDS
jgi:ferredoxin--NADP+ reductase